MYDGYSEIAIQSLKSADKLDYQEARGLYDQVIKMHPEPAYAYAKRGYCHHKLKNYEKAICDFDIAIGKKPRAKNTIWQRAISKWNLGLLDDALIDLERYLEINPKDAEAYYWMGKIAEEMHNDSLSAKFFRSAVELKPDYSEAKKCLKELLERNK